MQIVVVVSFAEKKFMKILVEITITIIKYET